MLEVRGVRKAYGQRVAVADVSLRVGPGEVLGLLGPNGAGKSTTLGIIGGVTPPDAGSVRVGGIAMADDPAGCRRRIGLVPQNASLFDDLPALANLQLFGALYGLRQPELGRRARAALDGVGLADRARDRPATFSGGMKRRLDIACALVHDPDVLLLDEPTAGVDPQSRLAIVERLAELARAGKALVCTTHSMEEAERLADRLVIVDHGRVVAAGTVAELSCLVPASDALRIDAEADLLADQFEGLDCIRSVRLAGRSATVALADLGRDTVAVLQHLAARGVTVRRLDGGGASLEEVFLRLTGHALRDAPGDRP